MRDERSLLQEQLVVRQAVLVRAATRFAERFQTEPMSKKEEADWLSLNAAVRHIDAQVAALVSSVDMILVLR